MKDISEEDRKYMVESLATCSIFHRGCSHILREVSEKLEVKDEVLGEILLSQVVALEQFAEKIDRCYGIADGWDFEQEAQG